MMDIDELLNDVDLFEGTGCSPARTGRVKKRRRTMNEQERFEELKIRTAMKARGISREKAEALMREQAKARAEAAVAREKETEGRFWR